MCKKLNYWYDIAMEPLNCVQIKLLVLENTWNYLIVC